MQKINAFKTDDGKIFENEEEAVIHDMELEFDDRLEKLCIDTFTYDMTVDDIFKAIKDNKQDFREIFGLIASKIL